MRLTCPNCGAQYEVPDEVIPESGRDVQCSNCGDTWFQHHPDHAPPPEEDQAEEQSWDAEPKPEPQPKSEDVSQDVSEDEGDESREDDAPSRRVLDPEVTSVLREEAERETSERAAEAGDGLETQPDLGLNTHDDGVDRRSRESQARMARLRGQPEREDAEDEDDDLDPGARSDLLPDIEEINSSLSSDAPDASTNNPADAEEMAAPRTSGFRSGFRMAVIIAVILLLLYVFAPKLASMVPALEGPLMMLTKLVDVFRAGIGALVGNVMGGGAGG